MLHDNDITDIMSSMRQEFGLANPRDIAYAILSLEVSNKKLLYELAYGAVTPIAEKHGDTPQIKKVLQLLEPYGIGRKKDLKITKDQNTVEMLRLLNDIKKEREAGNLDPKDALNMEKDIRSKLQDKFDIGESQDKKRIIIVPQKHDLICPHTQRECSSMPTKEACMKYYKLKEK